MERWSEDAKYVPHTIISSLILAGLIYFFADTDESKKGICLANF